MYQQLVDKKEKLAVIGLGYVGLPLALTVICIGLAFNKAKITKRAVLKSMFHIPLPRIWVPPIIPPGYLCRELFHTETGKDEKIHRQRHLFFH